MNQPFPTLFLSGRINRLEIRNRFIMGAMGTLSMDPERGCPTDRMISHYARRAQGGVGLIIVEPALVNDNVPPGVACLRLDNDASVPEFSRLASAIQENGAKAALQLVAPLNLGLRVKFEQKKPAGTKAKSNSYMAVTPPRFGYDAFKELSPIDLAQCRDEFAGAAMRAKAAGFDAVEFHACHGSFLCASLSPFSNRRTDIYGGSDSDRARLLYEIISSCREKTGPDFPLIVRLSLSEFLEGGTTLESTTVQAKIIEAAGADAIHLTGGSQHRLDWHAPPYYIEQGPFLSQAAQVRKELTIPVIAAGKISDMSMAENAVSENMVDFICIARPLLADPDFTDKIRRNQPEDIRPCIYCNKCHQSTFRNPETRGLACTVNPDLPEENTSPLSPAERSGKVLVAGGGLAGMEAARRLAERGHRVSLFERSDRLGGQWNIACREESKRGDFPKLLHYMTRRLEKAGVIVKLNHEVDINLIESEKPDAVILATGAVPLIISVPGVDGENVFQANAVILGKVSPGKRVAVIGAGYVGMEVAISLAKNGRQVSLVDLRKIGTDVGITIYHGLMERLVRYNVCLFPDSPVYEIRPNGIYIEYNHELLFLPVDTVVLATGAIPDEQLFSRLEGKVKDLYAIGDCVSPRDAMNAIHDGAELGERIWRTGMIKRNCIFSGNNIR